MKIAVLGAGTWGTALARLLAGNGHEVCLWSHNVEKQEEMRKTRRHPHLSGVTLPESLMLVTNLQQALANCDMVVFAVASIYMRETVKKAAPYLSDGQILVDVAKGIEKDTLLMMTGVIQNVLAKERPEASFRTVVLSGPTHAEEVAQDLVSTIVSASEEHEAALVAQDAFMNPVFRVYTNDDELGVQLCGALKNIIALAVGISDGLALGDNARAALMTRGMAEMMRLGLAMGCRQETFMGLAGFGDLIVTATSRHSRNHTAGMYIGQGYSAKEAVERVGQVVEGMNALPAALRLASQNDVEMPIALAVDAVLQGADVRETVMELMQRERKSEHII